MRAWHINTRFLRKPQASREPLAPGPTVVLVSSSGKSCASEPPASYDGSKGPFADTSDPEHFLLTSRQREAVTSLIDAVECNLGLSAFIAEAGAGKTTLLHRLLECYSTAAYTAILPRSCGSGSGLKDALLSELERMLKNGGGADRRVLIVLDEAHTLTSSELEVVRTLTTYRSGASKLLHLMLAGRLELFDMLSQPPLLDLRNRIIVVSRELHFNVLETERYINHRLKVARYSEPPIFRRDAVSEIVAVSRGIPRQINVICSEAMYKARELDTKEITGSFIREIVADPAFQLLSSPARLVDRPNAEEKNRAEQSGPLFIATIKGYIGQFTNSLQSGLSARPGRLALLQQIRLPRIIHGSYQEVWAAGFAAVAVAVLGFGVLYALTFGRTPHRTAEVAVTTQIATPQPQHQSVAPPSAGRAGSRASNSEAERSESLPLQSALRPSDTNQVLMDGQPGSQTPIASNGEGVAIDRLADAPVRRSVDTADTGSELPPTLPASASLKMPILNASGLNARVPASAPVTDGFQNLSDTTSPEVVKMVRPNYPSKAKKEKIHGEVVVTGVVGADGRLKMISTSGPTLLEEAAVRAAQEWRYKPPTLNGSPVEATARIVFNFSQPD